MPYDYRLALPLKHKHDIILRFVKEVNGIRHTYIAVHSPRVRGMHKFATYRVLDLGDSIALAETRLFATKAEAVADIEVRGGKQPQAHKQELAARFMQAVKRVNEENKKPFPDMGGAKILDAALAARMLEVEPVEELPAV